MSSRERNSWRSPRCSAVTRASSTQRLPQPRMARAQRAQNARRSTGAAGWALGGRLIGRHGSDRPAATGTGPLYASPRVRPDPARAARVRASGRARRRRRHRGLRLRLVLLPGGRDRALAFVVDGEPQPVAARGMPRLDPFRALHPELDPFAAGDLDRDPALAADPELRSYRSGFWGMVEIARPRAVRRVRAVAARRARRRAVRRSARRWRRSAGAERRRPLRPRWRRRASGPRVAIAMATYDPPADLFARQLDSIRAQTHGNWVCVISDDCSRPADQAIRGGNRRRRAIRPVSARPAGSASIATSSARWSSSPPMRATWRSPTRTTAGIPTSSRCCWPGSATRQLIYSDARVVARDGELISDTWWNRRRNNHSDLLSLLVANAVTGAASLLRRDLLDVALPFPPAQFAHFHDHWLGLVALRAGRDRLRGRAALRLRPARRRLARARRRQPDDLAARSPARRGRCDERVRLWRLHYFVDICRLQQFAAVLVMRCGPRMAAGQAPRAATFPRRRPIARWRWPGLAARAPESSSGPRRRSAPSGCSSTPSPGVACSGAARASGRSAACDWMRCRPRR